MCQFCFTLVFEHDKNKIEKLAIKGTKKRVCARQVVDDDDLINAWLAKHDIRKQVPKTELHATARDAFAKLNYAFQLRFEATGDALLKLVDQGVDLSALRPILVDFLQEQKLFHRVIEDLAIASPLMSPKRLGERATRFWNVFCSNVDGELIRDPYELSKIVKEQSATADLVLSTVTQQPPHQQSSTNTQPRPTMPRKQPKKQLTCYNYNIPEVTCRYRNCDFAHTCFCCSGRHPVFQCPNPDARRMLGIIRQKLHQIMARRPTNRRRF